MSSASQLAGYDGLGLAALVRNRQVTASEVVEAAIARIEQLDPKINALTYRAFDQARATTAGPLPDGPFTGVPFLLKDMVGTLAGTPTSYGNRMMRQVVSDHDSELVRRYRAAGLVILGKTNTSELGLLPFTEPEAYGPTHNPWDLARSPGGSSGGSAAAVAARMVPLAGGADGGGSIRIPASCCGVFGLKPTRGRIPTGPDLGELWEGLAIEHVITRSVRDSATILDCIAGVDAGAPYDAPAAGRPFASAALEDPPRLRIAFTTRPFAGRGLHEDSVRAVESTARLLADLGHELTEDRPVVDEERFALAFITVVAPEIRHAIELMSAIAGHRVSARDFETDTFALGLLGTTLRATRLVEARSDLQAIGRDMGRFFERYDVFLTPSLSEPPPPIGAHRSPRLDRFVSRTGVALHAAWILAALGALDHIAASAFDFMQYHPVANVTGQPAMSVPLFWNRSTLPIGSHFFGRLGDEVTLLQLAGQLERARPWAQRMPEWLDSGTEQEGEGSLAAVAGGVLT